MKKRCCNPPAKYSQLKAIYQTALDAGVEISTLPPLNYILEGKVNPFKLRMLNLKIC